MLSARIGPVDFSLICACIPSARRFEGRFGIHPASYKRPGENGVRFTIEAVRPGAPSEVLFDRTLHPGEVSMDRGFQSFSVPLRPDLGSAELTLRSTRQGSTEQDDPSWAFWSDLRKD